MDWGWLQNTGEWIAAVGGGVAVIFGVLRYTAKKIVRPTIQTFTEWQDAIKKIESEFKPNGGSSLKDVINRLEKASAYHRGMMKAIIADLPEGVFETDAAGHCTYVNRTYERLVGRSFEELRGEGWYQVVHHDDLDEVSEEWTRCTTQQREFNMKFRYVHVSGRIMNMHVVALPIKDVDGRVFGYFGRSAIID